MVNRRQFLGITVGAGATLAVTPALLRALQQPGGKLIQRVIPSSGEAVPAIGLSFSNHVSCADPAALREVFKAFVDNGGRVFDAMHGNAAAEQFHATLATELGIQDKLFWSTRGTAPGPSQPGPGAVKAHVETLLARLKVPRLDLAGGADELDELAAVGGGKKIYSYGYTYNGFAARLTASEANKLVSDKEVEVAELPPRGQPVKRKKQKY